MKDDIMPPDSTAGAWLRELGVRLRGARRALGVTAVAAAEAAGVSRVTWHRMEAGSPSVSAGSYARALESLGLAVVGAESNSRSDESTPTVPVRVRVGDFSELRALAWSLDPTTTVSAREALDMYERGSRHLSWSRMSDAERRFVENLRKAMSLDVST